MPRDESDARLWELFNSIRNTRTAGSLIHHFLNAQISLTPDRVKYLASQLWPHEVVPPASVHEFLASYFEANRGSRPISILDPWLGIGTPFVFLTKAFEPEKAVAISDKEPAIEVARILLANQPCHRLIQEQPLKALDTLDDNFDTIVSCPPFNVRPVTTQVAGIEVHDALEFVILLRACLKLTDGGVAACVVTPSFFRPHRKNSAFRALRRLGFHVEAIISIPQGAFSPATHIETALVLIRRGQHSQAFVAEMPESKDRREQIVANLLERRDTGDPSLGTLVDVDQFRGYRSLVAAYRAKTMARRLGIELIPLSSVTKEIIMPQRGKKFFDKANAIYLPMDASERVTTSTEAFSDRHHGRYIQIILDPEMANARYVAHFLNSPLGVLLRAQVQEGQVVPRLRPSAVDHLGIYLPPKDDQTQTLEIHDRIAQLVSELRELEDRLLRNPKKHREVARSVELINRKEMLIDWVESLPFPLASILWTYQSLRNDDEKKYIRLIKFFEAAAQFTTVVLYSALRNDEAIFEAIQGRVRDVLAQQSLSLRKSTYGTWVIMHGVAAKELRRQWSTDLKQALFRVGDAEIIDVLISKELVSLYQQVNSYRNDWLGHDGVIDEAVARERHRELVAVLSRFRALTRTNWLDLPLVRPKSGRFQRGVYYYECDYLMGTRTPFRSDQFAVMHPLEDQRLYLLNPDGQKALELLPLIKIRPSPRTAHDACYFFNRSEARGIRFISYHFGRDNELVEDDKDVETFIQMFEAKQVQL